MKRFLLIIMVLVSLVLLAGCQSKFEKQAKQIQDIKISVDQNLLDEMEAAKQKVNGK